MKKIFIGYVIIVVVVAGLLFCHKKVTQHVIFTNGHYVVITEGYSNRFSLMSIYYNKKGVESAEMVDSVLLNEEALAKTRIINLIEMNK